MYPFCQLICLKLANSLLEMADTNSGIFLKEFGAAALALATSSKYSTVRHSPFSILGKQGANSMAAVRYSRFQMRLVLFIFFFYINKCHQTTD